MAPRRRGRADRHGTHARYLPIRKLRRHRRENAAFEKEPPTLATDQSSTNLRRPKVVGRISTRPYHAADTHLARPRARTYVRTHARTHACMHARTQSARLSSVCTTGTSSRRSSPRECVCVCVRSLPFFRPTANFFRAFDFRSAFPACVSPLATPMHSDAHPPSSGSLVY